MPDWVLVSGGSGGIGAAICDLLAEVGYRPLVGYRSNAETAAKIAGRSGGAALPLDLSDPASIASAMDIVVERHLPLAGVVLAASPPPKVARMSAYDPAELSDQLTANVVGPFQLVAGLVRRALSAQRRGFVAAVLSEAMGGEPGGGARGMSPYITAKFGLLGLVTAARLDYPWLRVHTERPYFTRTAMLDAIDPRMVEMGTGRPIEEPRDVAGRIVHWIQSAA